MGQKQWLAVLIIVAVIALIVVGWRFWARTSEEPVIKFTPEQAKQAELERQRFQQGRGPQSLPAGETLPLPPKGGRRR